MHTKTLPLLLIFLIGMLAAACAPLNSTGEDGPSAPSGPIVSTSEPPSEGQLPPSSPDGQVTPLPAGPFNLAVAWERSGGIAGICERITIFFGGTYQLQSCYEGALPREGELPADTVTQLRQVLDQYSLFEWATPEAQRYPDAFVDRFVFNGQGSKTPSPDEAETIHQLIAGVYESAKLANPPPTPGAKSGIQGHALLGPACGGPVRVDQPCPDLPYQGEFLVLTSNEQEVTRFTTDEDGLFELELPPGNYIVRLNARGPLPIAPDLPVFVEPGLFTSLRILVDSGIR